MPPVPEDAGSMRVPVGTRPASSQCPATMTGDLWSESEARVERIAAEPDSSPIWVSCVQRGTVVAARQYPALVV